VSGTEEGLEAGQGVGKFVWIPERALEEVVLSFVGKGGGEAQGIGGNGRGSGEGVEVRVEGAEEKGGLATGFGEAEFVVVGGVVIEGEGKVDSLCRALDGR